MASQGYIPDFSTARLYPIVVLNTRDDPRLSQQAAKETR